MMLSSGPDLNGENRIESIISQDLQTLEQAYNEISTYPGNVDYYRYIGSSFDSCVESLKDYGIYDTSALIELIDSRNYDAFNTLQIYYYDGNNQPQFFPSNLSDLYNPATRDGFIKSRESRKNINLFETLDSIKQALDDSIEDPLSINSDTGYYLYIMAQEIKSRADELQNGDPKMENSGLMDLLETDSLAKTRRLCEEIKERISGTPEHSNFLRKQEELKLKGEQESIKEREFEVKSMYSTVFMLSAIGILSSTGFPYEINYSRLNLTPPSKSKRYEVTDFNVFWENYKMEIYGEIKNRASGVADLLDRSEVIRETFQLPARIEEMEVSDFLDFVASRLEAYYSSERTLPSFANNTQRLIDRIAHVPDHAPNRTETDILAELSDPRSIRPQISVFSSWRAMALAFYDGGPKFESSLKTLFEEFSSFARGGDIPSRNTVLGSFRTESPLHARMLTFTSDDSYRRVPRTLIDKYLGKGSSLGFTYRPGETKVSTEAGEVTLPYSVAPADVYYLGLTGYYSVDSKTIGTFLTTFYPV